MTKIDKDGNKSVVTISRKVKLIDSGRFMASSLSNLVDNLADKNHKVKGKDCDCFLEYESVKDNFVKYKCLSCNKDYSNKVGEDLKKRFKNTFKFSYNSLNMEEITDADYMHGKRVSKDFEIKHLVKNHGLYLKSDTLHLSDVF